MPQFSKRLARAIGPGIRRALLRFPIPALLAVVLTTYLLPDHVPDSRITGGLLACLPATLAVALFGEAKGWTDRYTRTVSAVVVAILGTVFAFAYEIELRHDALLAGLLILVGLAPYLRRATSVDRFWSFNQEIWLALGVSLAAAIVFAGGISAILRTLQYLFDVHVDGVVYAKTWMITLVLLLPVVWMQQIPRRFDEPADSEAAAPAVSTVPSIASIVMVPLLLIYAVILHVYALKILVDLDMPKGRIGWMVLAYGALLAATAFVTHPMRDSSSIQQLFGKVWPWLLPVPTALLLVAVQQRIGQYGLTEDRYFVLLAAAWFILLTLTQAVGGRWRDLRVAVALLAGLLLLSTAGPWGMAGLSTRMQTAELFGRLEAAGIMQDGRIPDDARARVTLLDSDRKRISEIIEYLTQRGRLDVLRPLFGGTTDDPFAKARGDASPRGTNDALSATLGFPSRRWPSATERALAGDVRERIGLPREHHLIRIAEKRRLSFGARAPFVLKADGPRTFVGPFHSYARRQTTTPALDNTISVKIEHGSIVVTDAKSQRSASFDLGTSSQIMAWRTTSKPSGKDVAASAPGEPPLVVARTAGDLDVEVHLINFVVKEDVGFESFGFWLSLAP